MGERRIQGLWNADREEMDRDWLEDMAWLKLSGSVPDKRASNRKGLMASFEKNPTIWAFAVIVLGGLAFLMATKLLF